MKKWMIVSMMSGALLLGGCGDGANVDPEAEEPTEAEKPNAPETTVTVQGTVESIVGTDVTLHVTSGSPTKVIVFHMADVDGDAFKNMAEGDTIEVQFNGVLTASEPPQASARDFSIIDAK